MKKITSLQVLRGLAFIGIFLEHSNIINAGRFCVSLFFVLSGFLLYFNNHNYDTNSCINFAISKIKKLYPLHIYTMLSVIPIALYELYLNQFSFKYVSIYLLSLIANITLTQSVFPNKIIFFSFNSVSWYLSTLFIIYLFFPFLKKIVNKYKKKSNATINMIIVYLAMLLFGLFIYSNFNNELMKYFTYIFPMYRLGEFFIGMNLSYIYINNQKINTPLVLKYVLLIIGYLLCVLDYMKQYQYIYHTLMFVPISSIIVLLFACDKRQYKGFLYRLGNISDYAFLTHQVIIRYLEILLNWLDNNYIVSVVSFLLTVFISALLKKYKNILFKHF